MRTCKAILVFLLLFIGLRHLQPQGILIYQGIAVGALVSGFQLAWARVRNAQSWRDSAKDGMITFLLIYAFVFTFPTTVDRSFSVKMLLHFRDVPAGLTQEDIGQFYVQDFVGKGGVEKRLTEQQVTGTIVERDGRYFLTRTGELLDSAFRVTCQIFVCR